MSAKPVQKTIVTRERVVAPPDRFIDVTDGELINYFQGTFPAADEAGIFQLHELLQGLCTNGFSPLRRALEQDFSYFAHAAAAEPGIDPRKLDPAPYAAELDAQEARLLANFIELLKAGQYKLLSSSEWDAAQAEDFLITLPVVTNWEAVDSELLPRALWDAGTADKADYPAELADRILIVHRGVDVARMRGRYLMQKLDLLLSFYLLQPLFRAFAWVMGILGIRRFVPGAPAYLARPGSAVAATTDEEAHAEAKAAARAIRAGALHEATVNVERRTFARAFPDGASVLRQLTRTVELREACFKDVVVLYRRALPDGKAATGEMELIKEAHPAFLRRNLLIKRFASIPMADLDSLVFPDKKIYMPPQVVVEMAVSIIGAVVALFLQLRGGINFRVMAATLAMLGSRAFAVYTGFNQEVTSIQRAMQQLLYDRTVASQHAVMASLTEEMANQRTRELMVAYCVLATAAHPLTLDQLDARCEAFLAAQFGLKLHFTAEHALPQLAHWGLATIDSGSCAAFRAAPLSEALPALDAVWDSIYDFSTPGAVAAAVGAVAGAADSTGKFLVGMFAHTVNVKDRARRIIANTTTAVPGAFARLRTSAKAEAVCEDAAGVAARPAATSGMSQAARSSTAAQSHTVPSAAVAKLQMPGSGGKKKGLFARLGSAMSPSRKKHGASPL